MQLDRSLALAEYGPWEYGQAQIDGSGIEGVNGLLQFYSEIFVDVESSGDMYQCLGEVRIYSPVSVFVGIG